MRVFVLSSTKKSLMPCHCARARELLKKGKAAIFRQFPFTIILKNREDGETRPLELKADPGSKTTGLSLVLHGKIRKKVIFSANLEHRGSVIKKRLEQRRGVRRARRDRNTRYRAPRFNNRLRCMGWLPPSLRSRVYNVETWANRFKKFSPISHAAVETVRFDMQKIRNPDIKDFLKTKPELLKKIKLHLQKPLKDAAAVNATRYAIGNTIKSLGVPTTFWSGGRTKFNRIAQGYKKDHWIDAACVGESGKKILIPSTGKILLITAQGHGDRQLCLVDKHGFSRSKSAGSKLVYGFQTGDFVTAQVTNGKKIRNYKGKVSVRSSGSFNISTQKETIQGISYRYCTKIHSSDGYNYSQKEYKCYS